MIGAEGGFDRDEEEKACAAGATPIWLGKRILRCETCPIAVTAIIMNIAGEMWGLLFVLTCKNVNLSVPAPYGENWIATSAKLLSVSKPPAL